MPEKDGETAPAAEANAEGQKAEGKGEEAAAAPPPKQMKSVVLTGFGSMKVIKVQQKPEPKPAEGEVLIRTKAW
nr:hypothetical protein BaRGS_011971 [Batillaria attramentaria]